MAGPLRSVVSHLLPANHLSIAAVVKKSSQQLVTDEDVLLVHLGLQYIVIVIDVEIAIELPNKFGVVVIAETLKHVYLCLSKNPK